MQVKLGEIKIPRTGNMRIWDQEEFAEIETTTVEAVEEVIQTSTPPISQTSPPQIQLSDEEKRILAELEELKRKEEDIVKQVEKIEKSQFEQAPQVDDHLQRRPSVPPAETASVLDEDSGHREIMRVKNVFPFDFFPDELIIEEARIVFRKRLGPFTKRIYSMLIKDISQSRLTTSLLFGRITIQDIFGENEITIDYLWKKKAYIVKGILDRLQARERRRITGVAAEDISQIVQEETLEEKEEDFFDTGW
jgi:hypothetical protein